MKTIRQLLLIALGITAGIGAYSLFRLGSAPSPAMANSTVDDVRNQPAADLAAVHPATPSHASRRSGRHGHHSHRRHREVAAMILAQASVSPSPLPPVEPAPTYFKADGYVEKADGQLEAIIIQNDGIQILRLGDRIGEHLRVTSISRESVGAIDEAAYHVPSDQPNQLDSPGSSDFPGVTVAYSQSSTSSHRPPSAGSRSQVLMALGSMR